jgi:vancomycin permeability regulator SanA
MSRRSRVRLAVVVVLLLLPLAPTALMRLGTWGDRHAEPGATPTRAVALVLGAGVLPGGTPTPFLQQRLDLAHALFEHRRVRAILVSGDHGRAHHDEPGAMKAYLLSRGVPARAVAEGHAGFSTYDSCFRAKAVFGVTEAIVVTQGFHLPRAVFTCRRLGIDAIGLGGSMWSEHRDETIRYSLREVLGTVKASWQLALKPDPHFLGPHETALDWAVEAGRP